MTGTYFFSFESQKSEIKVSLGLVCPEAPLLGWWMSPFLLCFFLYVGTSLVSFISFIFFRFYLFIFRERGRERGREGEKHRSITSHMCPGHTPLWQLNLQPRHVPQPGIEPVTFWFAWRCPVNWATLVGTLVSFCVYRCPPLIRTLIILE